MIYDTLDNIKNYESLGNIYDVLKFLAAEDFSSKEVGRYDIDGDNIYYMVQSYNTNPDKDIAEAHKKYIDIQLILEGEELIGVAPISCDKEEVEAKPEKDAWLYRCETDFITMKPGYYMVLYPNDIHLPGKAVRDAQPCRKIVVKIKI